MEGGTKSKSSKKNKNNIRVKINSTYIDEDDFELDCPNSPFVPTVLPGAERVIVIGDIHGDLELAIKSFELAKLLQIENGICKWVAEPSNTIVIQVGDQIDSCRSIPGSNCHKNKIRGDKSDDMHVIDFFNLMHELASKAMPKPGAVYSLLGNHELMNANKDFRYVSYANHYEFDYKIDGVHYTGAKGRKEAFEPGGKVSNMLACTRNSVMIIGSNMFVHAGVLPALVDRINNVEFDSRVKLTYLNSIVRKWLLGKMKDFDEDELRNKKLFVDNSDAISPFWTRIYGNIKPGTKITNNSECVNSVSSALKVFKIGKIIVGHTPQMLVHGVGINATCYEKGNDGNLWRVDGGFSRAFSAFGSQSIIQVLEILNDSEFNILTDVHHEIYNEEIIDKKYAKEYSADKFKQQGGGYY